MNKITGNEIVSGYDSNGESINGIPIRLHIAAMILAGDSRPISIRIDVREAIDRADSLIAAYNNTPNPNV